MFIDYIESLPQNALTESVKNLYQALVESVDGDAGNYFRKFIRSLPPNVLKSVQQDTLDVMREECPEESPENWVQWLWNWFRGDFNLRGTDAVYYAPGIARIVYGPERNQLDYVPKDGLSTSAKLLRDIVLYIFNAHKGEYTRFLVDKATNEPATFTMLKDKYRASLRERDDEDMAKLETLDYTPNDYRIIELKTFEDAHQFEHYTDPDTWCHFEDEYTFNSFQENGAVRLYLAVKPGFEKLRPGDPGYGQSMLGIDVCHGGKKGKLLRCNNRYNHSDDPELDNKKNKPGDNRFNAEELSLLLGGPFYEFCPYYTAEERAERGIITEDDIEDLLAKGADVSNVCRFKKGIGDQRIIWFGRNKYNIVTADNQLLLRSWAAHIVPVDFNDGEIYRVLYSNDKIELIDSRGRNIVGDQFDDIRHTPGGHFILTKDERKNILTKDGKLLFDKWYLKLPEKITNDRFMFADEDQPDGVYHLCDMRGHVISDLDIRDYDTGYGSLQILSLPYMRIEYVNKSSGDLENNVMDINTGKLVLPIPFDSYELSKEFNLLFPIRFAEDANETIDTYNILDRSNPTRYMLDKWCSKQPRLLTGVCYLIPYSDTAGTKFAYNVFSLDKRGVLLDFLADRIDVMNPNEDNSSLKIYKNGKCIVIDQEGRPLMNHWVDDAEDDTTGRADNGHWVSNDGKRNYVGRDGQMKLSEWFDEVYHGIGGAFVVTKLDENQVKWCNIYKDGKLLLDKWCNDIYVDFYKDINEEYYELEYGTGSKCKYSACDKYGRILLPPCDKIMFITKESFTAICEFPYYSVYYRGKRVAGGIKCLSHGFVPPSKEMIEGTVKASNGLAIVTKRYLIGPSSNGKMYLYDGRRLLIQPYADNIIPLVKDQMVFLIRCDSGVQIYIKDEVVLPQWYPTIEVDEASNSYLLWDNDGTGIRVSRNLSENTRISYQPISFSEMYGDADAEQ